MIKKIAIFFGFLWCGALLASSNGNESPREVARNLSDADMSSVDMAKLLVEKSSEKIMLNPFMFYYKNGVITKIIDNSMRGLLQAQRIRTIDDELDECPSQVELENKAARPVLPNFDDTDELEFFDAQQDASMHTINKVCVPVQEEILQDIQTAQKKAVDSQQQLLSIPLTAKDIVAPDEYSGYDREFDRLYRFAQRDRYLIQQIDPAFYRLSSREFKKYYLELMQQRQEMAAMHQAMGKQISKACDSGRLDISHIQPQAKIALLQIQNKHHEIYHENVIIPPNPRSFIDYKVPYQAQLQLNELELLKAKIVVDQLNWLQKNNKGRR